MTQQKQHKRNMLFGCVLFVTIITTLVLAIIGLTYELGNPPEVKPWFTLLLIVNAFVLMSMGAWIVGFNFYAALLRRLLCRWRGGDPRTLSNMSSIFICGTLFFGIAAKTFYWAGYEVFMWIAVVLLMLDFGGPIALLVYLPGVLIKK